MSSGVDTMQVDSGPDDIPALPVFLSSSVAYTMSPAALRLAINEHLREGDDLACVLEVFEGWISVWLSKEDALFPSKTASNNDQDLPPLAKVCLLNSSPSSNPEFR